MDIAIIGTGKMARAISTRLLMGGNHVSLVGHTPGKAEALVAELSAQKFTGSVTSAMSGTLPGEVVFLAVPYAPVPSILHEYIELLPGLSLVDITNPLNYQTWETLAPAGSSAAEEIAKLVPVNTRVVKAFNTTFAVPLFNGEVGGLPLDVFVASDDVEAKAKVSGLIEAGGLNAVDVGPLARARQLEALGLLHISMQSVPGTAFTTAIKLLH